jgi:hypothetical protein
MRAVLRNTLRVACICVVATSARAQGTGAALTHPGSLTVNADQAVGMSAPAAQRKSVFAAADRLLAVLRTDDGIAHPIGYAVIASRVAGITRVDGDDDKPVPSLPVHFGVTGRLSYYDISSTGEMELSGGRVPFSVIANGIGRIENVETIPPPLDNGAAVVSGYRVTGQFRNHPIYDGSCVVITNRPTPPLLPVTKERYLRLVILGMRADSTRHAGQFHEMAAATPDDPYAKWVHDRPKREADMRKTYDELKKVSPDAAQGILDAFKQQEVAMAADSDAMRGGAAQVKQLMHAATDSTGAMIRRLQTELNGLSPAERNTPVAVMQHGVDWDWRSDQLAEIDNADAVPLMQLNPAFFDKSLAPDVPQIITVCLPQISGEIDKDYERHAGDIRTRAKAEAEKRLHDALQIRDHLDWAALEALVKR